MELIDKAAVVAEIDRIIEEPAPSHDSQCSWEDGYYCGLCKAESIIDTLKVKEMDVEKEIKSFTEDLFHKVFDEDKSQDDFDWDDIATVIEYTAKHFFELGIKTQKDLTV